MEKKLTD
jgi:hypothetical protein